MNLVAARIRHLLVFHRSPFSRFRSDVARRLKPVPKARTKIVLDDPHERHFQNDTSEVTVVDSSTRTKNAILALTLTGFCFGVAWYSMNAVGQAGVDNSDPLSVLKLEAASAQARNGQLDVDENTSADLVKQFQAGVFDPDKIEETISVDASKDKMNLKPWWKLW
jgi:hypothetical protein